MLFSHASCVRITIKNAISARNIDEHDTRIEELIALVADHVVSRAAFAEAVRRRHNDSDAVKYDEAKRS